MRSPRPPAGPADFGVTSRPLRATSRHKGAVGAATGVGSVLGGPVAAYLYQATGSWIPIFLIAIAMDWTTAVLAIRVLKPMRQRWRERVTGPAVESSKVPLVETPA